MQAMATSNTLQDDLRELITIYVQIRQHHSIRKANTAELIVMACIMSDEPLSIPEVLSWVRRHSTKILSDVLPAWLLEVRPDFADFRVPICEVVEQGSKQWTSPIAAAHVFLRRRLFPHSIRSPQAHFRIMDLPAEVRVSIFEFALLLPRSGVWYDIQNRATGNGQLYQSFKVWTADRDLASNTCRYLPSHWNIDKDTPFSDSKSLFRVHLARHLTLFRVSKQVYKEALPAYYSQNVFYLPNDWATLQLFQNFSVMQFHHLGNIVWRWPKKKKPARKLVQSLAALPRLRTLVIDTPPAEPLLWWAYGDGVRRQAGLSADDVAQLTEIRGLQDVTFFGAILEHEEFLRSHMIGHRA
jgi:hypothetical protein